MLNEDDTVTDQVFESGHCDCVSGQVTLAMCADGAEMLTLLLKQDAEKWDHIDPSVAYYMRAFAADIQVQVTKQKSGEVEDTVPADWL
jgi:hypothetical protein